MIIECTIQQPTLLRTLQGLLSVQVTWEKMDRTADDERLLLFWVETDDFGAFESAMDNDPTVTDPQTLTTFGNQRLYQVEQTADGKAQAIYPSIVNVGGIVQQATVTQNGWTYQIAFPDNDALGHFHDICTDHDLEFVLHRKYERSTTAGEGIGLTAKQRDVLARAVKGGYYEVPRRIDLKGLAAELDISHQAASERLRRAVDTLSRTTILTENDAVEPVE
jgi:hypothetical protein